ncbi:DUF6932 family protein [Alcanivorax sp.]|uniref:DUF6932 family protein n=1 Tax=Alcanivorax sp. TaxID=1872427 RepID=UPI002B26E463|nr:hypothetical protein [Alcanivorax sp.]
MTYHEHNINVVFMIPALITLRGAPWRVLPPGLHWASLDQVREAFAYNPHRRKLFSGLYNAANALSVAGCKHLFLDGSYVTSKPKPGDFDGSWNPENVNPSLLDPVLLDFEDGRRNQKLKYLGELFPASADCGTGRTFFEFFQLEKHTGGPKGMIAIDLTNETFCAEEGGKQ